MKPSPLHFTEGLIELMFCWSFSRVGVNTNRSEAHCPTPFARAGSNCSRDGVTVTCWESVQPPSPGLSFRPNTSHSTASCSSLSSPAILIPPAPSQTALLSEEGEKRNMETKKGKKRTGGGKLAVQHAKKEKSRRKAAPAQTLEEKLDTKM